MQITRDTDTPPPPPIKIQSQHPKKSMNPEFKFYCDHCGYGTNHKGTMTRHENRRTPCVQNNTEKSKNSCQHCYRQFANVQNLRIHVQHHCPVLKNKNNQKITHGTYEMEVVAGFTEMIIKLINTRMVNDESLTCNNDDSQNHKDEIHNNSHNTINNNTINVTNNVTVTALGNELPVGPNGRLRLNPYTNPNLEHLTPECIAEIMNDPTKVFNRMSEHIYFNPSHPENHSIGPYDKKSKTHKVYDGDEFKEQRGEEVTSATIELYNQHMQMLQHIAMILDRPETEKTKIKACKDYLKLMTGNRPEFWAGRNSIATIANNSVHNDILSNNEVTEFPPPTDSEEYKEWIITKRLDELYERECEMFNPVIGSMEYRYKREVVKSINIGMMEPAIAKYRESQDKDARQHTLNELNLQASLALKKMDEFDAGCAKTAKFN